MLCVYNNNMISINILCVYLYMKCECYKSERPCEMLENQRIHYDVGAFFSFLFSFFHDCPYIPLVIGISFEAEKNDCN